MSDAAKFLPLEVLTDLELGSILLVSSTTRYGNFLKYRQISS